MLNMPEARTVPLLGQSIFPASPVLIPNAIHFPLPWIASFARTLGSFLASSLSRTENRLGALPPLFAALIPGMLPASGTQLGAWQGCLLQGHGPGSTGRLQTRALCQRGRAVLSFSVCAGSAWGKWGSVPCKGNCNHCLEKKNSFFLASGCLS